MSFIPPIPITTSGGQGTVVLGASGLPAGLTLTDNGDGTGEITGTLALPSFTINYGTTMFVVEAPGGIPEVVERQTDGTEVTAWSVPSGVASVATHPETGDLWVLHSNTTLERRDRTDGTILETVTLAVNNNRSGMDFHPVTGHLYVGEYADPADIQVFDPDDNWSLVTTLTTARAFIQGTAFDASGRLFIHDALADNFYELDPDTGADIGVLTGLGSSATPSLTFDGDGKIWVTNTSGSDSVSRFEPEAPYTFIESYSPNGTTPTAIAWDRVASTPVPGASGGSPYTVTITATDDLDRTSRRVFEFTVNALTVDAIADQAVQENDGLAPTFAPALSINDLGLQVVGGSPQYALFLTTDTPAATPHKSAYIPANDQDVGLRVKFRLDDTISGTHSLFGSYDFSDGGISVQYATDDKVTVQVGTGPGGSVFNIPDIIAQATFQQDTLLEVWFDSATTDLLGRYSHDDGETWTNLTTVETTNPVTVLDPVDQNQWQVAGTGNGGNMDGRVYYAEVFDNVTGDVTLRFSADNGLVGDTGAATVTDARSGAVWTLNGGEIVGEVTAPRQPTFAPALSVDTINHTVVAGENELVQPTFSYADVVLADNPVAYWRLGEASGTTAADETGNHDGTYQNTPTLGATGLISEADTAVTFVAANSEDISVPHDPALIPGGTFSIEFWFNCANAAQAASLVAKRTDSGGFQQYNVGVGGWTSNTGSPATKQLRFLLLDSAGNDRRWETTADVVDGNTHHVVVTSDATAEEAHIYVDGVDMALTLEYTSGAWPAPDSLSNLGIASRIGGAYFDGTLDEVAFYNTVLSPEQVTAHYNAGS